MTGETDWQDIETAPKDGNYFIAWSEKESNFLGSCTDPDWFSHAPHPIIIRWMKKARKDKDGTWHGAFCDGQRGRLIFHATKWKPL